MHIADLLSRNYINNEFDKEINIEGVVHSINNTINVLKIAEATKHDLVLVKILEYYNEGWLKDKNKISGEFQHYWSLRNDIVVEKGVIYVKNKIIMPYSP